MVRPRYQSDDDRLKTRPHTKIHHTTRTHRKTAAHWHRADFRGQFLGLLQVAVMAHAARDGGRVYLGRQDVEFISGKRRRDVALTSVERLADVLEYHHERLGDVLVIDIPKLAEKQGFHPALGGVTPRTPSASEAEADTETDTPPYPPGGAGSEDGFKNDGNEGPRRLRDLSECERKWAHEMATGKDPRWIEQRDGLHAGELDRLSHVVGGIRSRLERGLSA